MGIVLNRRKPGSEQETADMQAESRPMVLTEGAGAPEAYALLFDEAVRNLSAQEASLDELRARAGVMLSAAGVVAAFLGSATLTVASALNTEATAAASGRATDWHVLVAIYVGIVVAIFLTFWSCRLFVGLLPARKGWVFRVGTTDLLKHYIESPEPASLPVIHRSLAWYFEASEKKNETELNKLYDQFRNGARFFTASLVLWFVLLSGAVAARLL